MGVFNMAEVAVRGAAGRVGGQSHVFSLTVFSLRSSPSIRSCIMSDLMSFDEPRKRIHNAAASGSSAVAPSATFVSSASISKSNRVETEDETDPNAKSTRKRFRLGHILGAAFLIMFFAHDLMHTNGDTGLKFSDFQGLAQTTYSPMKTTCLDPFPEFEDIE